MTDSAKPKLRLYDRLLNWLHPVSPEEAAYLAQEVASLKQHERVLRAEAERLELENRAKAAEVALVEEANQRVRDTLNRMVVRGRAEYEFRSKINNTWTEITAALTLSESKTTRQVEFSLFNTKDHSLVHIDITNPRKFVETQPSYALWILPWMQSSLEIDDLTAMKADDCFKRFFVVGKKKTG